MRVHIITIEWEGPLSIEKTSNERKDGGEAPEWGGDDYGLYQVYGEHILCGKNTLLYIGKTTEQTFSERIQQHYKDFLKGEQGVEVYLGRVFDPRRHSSNDGWQSWCSDIDIAERIMIYKYCPNYNSQSITEKPSFLKYARIKLQHRGAKNRLKPEDTVPDDL